MFGKNRIVTPKAFAGNQDCLTILPKEKGVFYTLQGEGPFAGRPAVFIRLSYCNLQCFFCDSAFDDGEKLPLLEIFDRISQAVEEFNRRHNIVAAKLPLLVITGGEPTMQPALSKFLEMAHARGYRTQIESNGMFCPKIPLTTFVVVSPKVNEKTGQFIRVHPFFLAYHVNALKFVISGDAESPYHDIPAWALQWADETKQEIYVSPMNIYKTQPEKGAIASFWTGILDNEQNQRNHEHAAFIAMKYGAILSIQQHLYVGLP